MKTALAKTALVKTVLLATALVTYRELLDVDIGGDCIATTTISNTNRGCNCAWFMTNRFVEDIGLLLLHHQILILKFKKKKKSSNLKVNKNM